MVKDTEDKKGFWNTWLGKTVSFVGKYTGISWILGKISSVWKSWFSSSGATKAGAANSSASEAPNNDTGIPAPGLEEGQGRAAQVQNLDQEDEVDSVSNGLSATDPLAAGRPAEPTPSNGTSATPLSGPAGPDNGKTSFDVKKTQAPQPRAPEVEKLSGKITVFQNKTLELYVGENEIFDTLKKWQNPANSSANSEEFRAFMEHGGKTLYITGRYDSRKKINGIMVTINSVGIHNNETVYGDDNLEGMKNLLGLNKTTAEVNVEISNVPFEAPEVKSSKTPEKTTENGSEVKPEMKKASKAEKPTNVVDAGLSQPQPKGDSKDETVTAGPEVVSPVVVVNDETQGSETAKSSKKQPAAAGGQFEDVLDIPGKQPQVSGAATTTPKGGTGTAEPEEQPDEGQEHVDEVSGSPISKVESTEDQGQDQQQRDATPLNGDEEEKERTEGGPKAIPSEPEGAPESPEDQGKGQQQKEDKASLIDSEEEKEHTKDVPEAPSEDRSKAAPSASDVNGGNSSPEAANPSNAPLAPIGSESAEGGQEPESKAPEGQEDEQVKGIETPPRTTSADLKSEHVPTTNGKSGPSN